MISMARTFGAPDTVPAGKPRGQRIERIVFAVELALDIGDDVHDLAVALDEELVRSPSRVPIFARTRPTSLRPRSSSIRCSARSFGIGQQLVGQRLVVCLGVAPRGRVPAIGRMVTVAVAQPHQDFRARADHRESRRNRG